MDLQLKGKVMLVAASSSGLGYGIAEQAAAEGATVYIGSRRAEAVSDAAERIAESTGNKPHGGVLDASDPNSISAWVQNAIDRFGRVDGLLVNAGGPPAGGFDDFDDDAWQDAFELTLMSSVRMIRAVLPQMKKQRSGSILTITSSSVKEPIRILLLSNVMRSGVTSLVKSLSFELAEQGIRINNIVPGRIDTGRVKKPDSLAAEQSGCSYEDARMRQEKAIPMGRYGQPNEFGRAAVFLLSEAASYVTGETMIVDGGMMRTVW